MRKYLVRSGKYEGEHNIYDSPEEFLKTHKGYDLKRWGIELVTNLKKGQWIRAEDDFVVQVLYVKALVNKGGYTSWFTRFPMGLITAYKKKDGTIHHQQFYAMFTFPSKNSATNRQRIIPTGANQMKLAPMVFVKMFVGGVHPHQAFRVAYNDYKHYTNKQINAKIDKILERGEVMSAVVDSLGKAKDMLAERKITVEAVVNKIKQHWDNVPKGTTQELNAIKFVGPIVGLDFERKLTKGEKATSEYPDPEEAEFKEVDNEALPAADITSREV